MPPLKPAIGLDRDTGWTIDPEQLETIYNRTSSQHRLCPEYVEEVIVAMLELGLIPPLDTSSQ